MSKYPWALDKTLNPRVLPDHWWSPSQCIPNCESQAHKMGRVVSRRASQIKYKDPAVVTPNGKQPNNFSTLTSSYTYYLLICDFNKQSELFHSFCLKLSKVKALCSLNQQFGTALTLSWVLSFPRQAQGNWNSGLRDRRTHTSTRTSTQVITFTTKHLHKPMQAYLTYPSAMVGSCWICLSLNRGKGCVGGNNDGDMACYRGIDHSLVAGLWFHPHLHLLRDNMSYWPCFAQ